MRNKPNLELNSGQLSVVRVRGEEEKVQNHPMVEGGAERVQIKPNSVREREKVQNKPTIEGT